MIDIFKNKPPKQKYLPMKRYQNINFIRDGGWHFTTIKKPEDLDYKMKSFLHHLEYEESGLDAKKLKRIIDEKKVTFCI